MARPARPWFRKSRRMWFFTAPDGKQVPTGITDPTDESGATAARQRYIDDLAAAVARVIAHPPPIPAPHPAGRLVSALVPEFLARRKPKVSAGTHRGYTFALATHFAPAFGPREVESLKAEEIEDWADRASWSPSYRNTTLGAVATWLKWCRCPLALKRPPKESRGASVVLTDDQFARVLGAYDVRFGSADFAALLTVLRETGGRPQEVARLTVEAIDWPNRCAKLRDHKTKTHGADRVLHFSAAAVLVLAAQRVKHGTGLLFRTRAGNAYRDKMIVQQMQRISARVGFRAIAYGLGRHSFATKALGAGVSDSVVAALLGHKSTRMIHAHYSHLGDQSKVLRAALEKMARPA